MLSATNEEDGLAGLSIDDRVPGYLSHLQAYYLARERDQVLDVIDITTREPAAMRSTKSQEGTHETLMQEVPTDAKKRAASSRVLEEVVRQAPAEYVTVGWLTSSLHQSSFGIIMLSLDNAVSWTAGDDAGRFHGPRAHPRNHGGAIDYGPQQTCLPAFHHDATLTG